MLLDRQNLESDIEFGNHSLACIPIQRQLPVLLLFMNSETPRIRKLLFTELAGIRILVLVLQLMLTKPPFQFELFITVRAGEGCLRLVNSCHVLSEVIPVVSLVPALFAGETLIPRMRLHVNPKNPHFAAESQNNI